MAKTKKRKQQLSTDQSKSCKKCGHFDSRNPENPICSLDGNSINPEGTCKSFDSSCIERCTRCGKEVKYSSRKEYYDNVIHFTMVAGTGSACGQNIHLCKKCENYAWDKFHDYLEDIRTLEPIPTK